MNNLSSLQKNVRSHLFRKKQIDFLTKLKEKCKELLEKHGAEFLDQKSSARFLSEKGFINNRFPFKFITDINLKNNKQAYTLVSKFYNKHISILEDFYKNLSKRQFNNLDCFPVYKDKQTGLTYFSYFNLLNSKNIGHTLIFGPDNTIVELLISNENCKINKGIIYFTNGDFYIGKLYTDKISFLNFEDKEPMREMNIDSIENNINKNSESNNLNDNFTIKTNDKLKEKGYLLYETNPFNNVLNNLNFSQIEKIINIHPCEEGIFIKKSTSEVIASNNWEHADPALWNKVSLCEKEKQIIIEEYQNINSKDNIIHSQKEFLNFFKNEKVIKSALVFDFLNNSKYGGEVVFKNREIIKHGKGDIEFANSTFYEGKWRNNLFHGEGVFYERFDNNLQNKFFSKSTNGTWLNGKLNGKGIVTKENSSLKELCVWRFGRLINNLKVLNKKVKLNDDILNFLKNDDLVNLISIKNKAFYDFFTKNNKAKIRMLKENNKGSILKSKAANNSISNQKKITFEPASSADNFIGKQNLNENYKTENDLFLKSPGANNNLEENKESDVYVDCISNEEAFDNLKPQRSEKTKTEEDCYEKLVPYDPENDEENRFIYNFINDKYKQIDGFLNRNWTIMEDKKDFKSFYFDEISKLRSIKSEVIINENIHVIKDFLMDLTERHKYNKNLDYIKNIRLIGKSYSIKYMKLKSVFILSSRDFLSAEKVVDKEDQVIMMSSSFESPKYPVIKGIVRGENKLAATILTKIDEKTTKIISFSCVDIKFSQTLVNTGLKEAARNILIVKSILEAKK